MKWWSFLLLGGAVFLTASSGRAEVAKAKLVHQAWRVPSPDPPSEGEGSHPGRALKAGGIALTSVGGLNLLASVYFASTGSTSSTSTNRHDDGSMIAVALFGFGAALVGTGIAAIVVGKARDERARQRGSTSLVVGPASAAVRVGF